MTLTHLSDRVGVSVVNLSILKNNRAKAIRLSTLTAICEFLACDIGDILTIRPPTGHPEVDGPVRSRILHRNTFPTPD